jgi:hypothetical protein
VPQIVAAVWQARKADWCNHSWMDEVDAGQAVELIRALREQLHQMTHQLASLDRQDAMGTSSRASAVRSEAAALRRDINEAKVFIDRLQRRYLISDAPAPRRAPDAKNPMSGHAGREVMGRARIRPIR